MKTKAIIAVVLIPVVGFLAYNTFLKKKESPYDWALVKRQNIVQKVSATGQVMSAKKIDLQFEIQGKIADIKTVTGNQVKAEDVLVSLNAEELNAKVLEAQAARNVAGANLEKLMAGSSKEEIRVYQTAVENAQIALSNANSSLENYQQILNNVKDTAADSLDSAYEDAVATLNDSYLSLYNALQTVKNIQLAYFVKGDQESITVIDSRIKIEADLSRAKASLDAANAGSENEDVDKALVDMKGALQACSLSLAVIRQTCETVSYRDVVSSANKAALDTQRANISTALTDIIATQQTISSTKLSNEANINTAQNNVDSAQNSVKTSEGNLKSAQDKLVQITAPPQSVDISLAQAKVDQAEASLAQSKQQLGKANLVSPCDGQITDILLEQGEQANPSEVVASMMCQGNFQIEVDIPEADIGKVNVLNSVTISLDAFPEQTFSGKVLKIDPAETAIQGVIYYKVTVGFENLDDKIKSGMTADVDIVTDSRENVLTVPQRSVLGRNGDRYIRVLEGEKMKETAVVTGIKGNDGDIEIQSGVNEGDKVITFVKEQ